MRSFLHVEVAYDVDMRRYIPVNILFTSLTMNNTQDCLAGLVYRQCFSLGLVRNPFSNA